MSIQGSQNSGVSTHNHLPPTNKKHKGLKAIKGFKLRSVFTTSGKAVLKRGQALMRRHSNPPSSLQSKKVATVPKKHVHPKLTQSNQSQALRRSSSPANEPSALTMMRKQNEQRQQNLLRDLENLPTAPTDKPKGPGRSSRLTSARNKALTLPSSFKGLSNHISKITTSKEALETWNALTTIAIQQGTLSDVQLSLLKDQCVARLVSITNDPAQADFVTERDVNVLLKHDSRKRDKVMSHIVSHQSATLDIEHRLNNLRNRQ